MHRRGDAARPLSARARRAAGAARRLPRPRLPGLLLLRRRRPQPGGRPRLQRSTRSGSSPRWAARSRPTPTLPVPSNAHWMPLASTRPGPVHLAPGPDGDRLRAPVRPRWARSRRRSPGRSRATLAPPASWPCGAGVLVAIPSRRRRLHGPARQLRPLPAAGRRGALDGRARAARRRAAPSPRPGSSSGWRPWPATTASSWARRSGARLPRGIAGRPGGAAARAGRRSRCGPRSPASRSSSADRRPVARPPAGRLRLASRRRPRPGRSSSSARSRSGTASRRRRPSEWLSGRGIGLARRRAGSAGLVAAIGHLLASWSAACSWSRSCSSAAGRAGGRAGLRAVLRLRRPPVRLLRRSSRRSTSRAGPSSTRRSAWRPTPSILALEGIAIAVGWVAARRSALERRRAPPASSPSRPSASRSSSPFGSGARHPGSVGGAARRLRGSWIAASPTPARLRDDRRDVDRRARARSTGPATGGVVLVNDPLETIEEVARAYDIRWLVLNRADTVAGGRPDPGRRAAAAVGGPAGREPAGAPASGRRAAAGGCARRGALPGLPGRGRHPLRARRPGERRGAGRLADVAPRGLAERRSSSSPSRCWSGSGRRPRSRSRSRRTRPTTGASPATSPRAAGSCPTRIWSYATPARDPATGAFGFFFPRAGLRDLAAAAEPPGLLPMLASRLHGLRGGARSSRSSWARSCRSSPGGSPPTSPRSARCRPGGRGRWRWAPGSWRRSSCRSSSTRRSSTRRSTFGVAGACRLPAHGPARARSARRPGRRPAPLALGARHRHRRLARNEAAWVGLAWALIAWAGIGSATRAVRLRMIAVPAVVALAVMSAVARPELARLRHAPARPGGDERALPLRLRHLRLARSADAGPLPRRRSRGVDRASGSTASVTTSLSVLLVPGVPVGFIGLVSAARGSSGAGPCGRCCWSAA